VTQWSTCASDVASIHAAPHASSEQVTQALRGEPLADIVPHGRRARWLSGEQLRDQLRDRAADPGLTRDLDELAGQTLDEL